MGISIKYLLLILLASHTYITMENKMANMIMDETNNTISANTTSASMVLQYLVREPKIKSEKKKAIVLLHGVGSNENDLFRLANELPNDYFIISPRGQFTLGAGRYAWYQVDFSTGKPVFNEQQELSSREVIRKFVGQIKHKYDIDEVYLGGFSQGAIMSFSIGLTNPTEVKGIISLSGRLLEEIRPLVSRSDDLQKMRVFVAHGVQDGTLPIHYAREANAFLQSFDIQLNYHEYNIGHQINAEVIKDLNKWLK